MSAPTGSGGQELVPVGEDSTQLMPMDVNGADQPEPRAVPRVEEPAEGSRSSMPGPSQSQEPVPEVVDARIFVHAPQYHWHQEGGVDAAARAAIETLHKNTHDFAVATVHEVDALNERVDGVSERINTTAAAVEQQLDMLLTSGQGAQQWQEIAQKEISQTRTDLVEGLGRVTALESTVQKIKEAQEGQTLKKEIMELVNTRLQTFEAQIDANLQEWTGSIVQGCQNLEEQMEGIQEQLGEIQQKQTEFQMAFDSIVSRLEQVETARLQSIPEGSTSPPGGFTADSVRSLPQLVCQTLGETHEEEEKRVGGSVKDFSVSRMMTVLQEPSRVTTEGQEAVQKGKRSPSPEGEYSWIPVGPKSFASFTLGDRSKASGVGGTSGGGGPPGGPPEGPSGSGGGDPGDGLPRGRVPQWREPVPAARPQAVGALRLEAPARYAGGAKPGVRAWLREVSRWMRLMDYPQAKWIDIVATRTEGAAASWLSHEQIAMERGMRALWAGWADFSQEMIRAFEPTTDDALARQQLAALKQTGRVAGYIQKFREIRGRIQDMSVQDEFAAFIRGLQPRIKTQVGALVEEDLAAAMRLAARLELWTTDTSGGESSGGRKQQGRGKGGGQGARSGGQGPKNQGKVQVVESSVAAVDKGGKKKGQQQQQQGKGQGQGKRPPCYLCQGPHYVKDCPNMKAASEALKKAQSKNA